MNLATQFAVAKGAHNLTLAERLQNRCDIAKQLERAGEYEAAFEALVEVWPDRHGPPKVEGLDDRSEAEVLLRVGALAGWLGSAHGAEGQEKAKNLLTQ